MASLLRHGQTAGAVNFAGGQVDQAPAASVKAASFFPAGEPENGDGVGVEVAGSFHCQNENGAEVSSLVSGHWVYLG